MIRCISYWSMPGGLQGACEVATAMDLAHGAGFDGIELAIGRTGVLTPQTSQPACHAYRRLAEAKGLALQTLASGMSWECSPTNADPTVRRESIRLHQAALERAAWLGCQAMLYVPGAVTIPWDTSYAPVPYVHAAEWARLAISELAGTAEALGVDLCIENVWNGLFYSPIELANLVDTVKSPALGIYLDVGNLLGCHQYPPHWITYLAHRIRRVHIKDFKTDVGSLAGFCELLTGDVPWQPTVHALRAIGYDRTLVAEMLPHSSGLLERTARAMGTILAS